MSTPSVSSVQKVYATIEEVAQVIISISEGEKAQLSKSARIFSLGLREVQWTDLLQEATKRVLQGTRKWPKDISFVFFLGRVMESLASYYWKRHYRRVEVGIGSVCDYLNGDDKGESIIEQSPSEQPDPHEIAEAKEVLEQIEEAFQNDELGLAVLMAKEEGYSRQQIKSDYNISDKGYDTTMKRISRRLARIKLEVSHDSTAE
jgi:DNA-directed RNA polymerase specialized sigma subunit, sigma24 homolog